MIIKNLKKIAFIKYGGFASGGTEVSFQTLAKHLSETYEVDYYYCDPTPYIGSDYTHPPTDVFRKEYLTNSKVNIIKFNVEFKELKDGNYKTIAIYSKKARGLMTRFIIDNRITTIDKIKEFNLDKYIFSESLSSKYNFVFCR